MQPEIKNLSINSSPIAILVCMFIAPLSFCLIFSFFDGALFGFLCLGVVLMMATAILYDKQKQKLEEAKYLAYLSQQSNHSLIYALANEELTPQAHKMICRVLNQNPIQRKLPVIIKA